MSLWTAVVELIFGTMAHCLTFGYSKVQPSRHFGGMNSWNRDTLQSKEWEESMSEVVRRETCWAKGCLASEKTRPCLAIISQIQHIDLQSWFWKQFGKVNFMIWNTTNWVWWGGREAYLRVLVFRLKLVKTDVITFSRGSWLKKRGTQILWKTTWE